MSPRPTPHTAFRPDIEALRALAVLLVVLFHAGLTTLSGGYVGVDVFFVLSGFLITSLLTREGERYGRVYLRDFYARRARRILPATLLVLSATVLLAHLLLPVSRVIPVFRDASWATLFLANFHFASSGVDYFSATLPPSPLQHLWSLSVEEQFYLAWPLVLLLLFRLVKPLHPRRWVATLASLAFLSSLTYSLLFTTPAAYFSPFTRAWEIALGALLSCLPPLLPRLVSRLTPPPSPFALPTPPPPETLAARLALPVGLLGLAGIVLSALLYSSSTRFPGSAALLPTLSTALVLQAGATPSLLTRVLSFAPFQTLGRLSFSLYLWHWPLLILAPAFLHHSLTPLTASATVLLALLLSFLSFSLVENPVRVASSLSLYPSRALTAGLASLALASLVLVYALPSLPSKPLPPLSHFASASQIHAALVASTTLTSLPTTTPSLAEAPTEPLPDAENPACAGSFDTVDVDTHCVYGDTSSPHTLVLFGDSHANMWLGAFDEMGRLAHWKVVLVTKPACPPVDLQLYQNGLRREYRECDTWRPKAVSYVASLHADIVVATASGHDVGRALSNQRVDTGMAPYWLSGMQSVLLQLKSSTPRLVVLGDTPALPEDASTCLLANPDPQACSAPVSVAGRTPLYAAEVAAAQAVGVQHIDTLPWICSDTCTPVVNGMLVYRDHFHLTDSYARYLTGVLAPQVGLPLV